MELLHLKFCIIFIQVSQRRKRKATDNCRSKKEVLDKRQHIFNDPCKQELPRYSGI